MIARNVRVTGRVQGVVFRQSAADRARQLGVAGWVRNCSDGSVEAHVEGEEDAIEAMIGLLREGPPEARVEDVRVEEASSEGSQGFEIRH